MARAEFARYGKVLVTQDEHQADFVFLLVIDPTSHPPEILAELLDKGCFNESEDVRCNSHWHASAQNPVALVDEFHKEAVP